MNYKGKLNKQIGASAERRTVVVDIETVSLDATDDQGALNAMKGRVVCIGMLVDDSIALTEMTFAGEDERSVISDLWDALKPSDVLVGHNVLDFDLPFLQQRSWILGIKPNCAFDTRRYYTKDVIDTLQLWTNSGRTGPAIREESHSTPWGQFLGVDGKPVRERRSPSGGKRATSNA